MDCKASVPRRKAKTSHVKCRQYVVSAIPTSVSLRVNLTDKNINIVTQKKTHTLNSSSTRNFRNAFEYQGNPARPPPTLARLSPNYSPPAAPGAAPPAGAGALAPPPPLIGAARRTPPHVPPPNPEKGDAVGLRVVLAGAPNKDGAVVAGAAALVPGAGAGVALDDGVSTVAIRRWIIRFETIFFDGRKGWERLTTKRY